MPRKPAVKKRTTRNIKGVVVFYKNVGNLAPNKVESFLKECAEKVADLVVNIKASGYDVVWMPNRDGPNRVELMRL